MGVVCSTLYATNLTSYDSCFSVPKFRPLQKSHFSGLLVCLHSRCARHHTIHTTPLPVRNRTKLSSCALFFLHRTFLLAAVVRVNSSTSHAYWLKITSLNGALLLVGRFLSRRVRFVELRLKCNGVRAETRFPIGKKRTSPFQ